MKSWTMPPSPPLTAPMPNSRAASTARLVNSPTNSDNDSCESDLTPVSDQYEVRISREASSHLEEIFNYIERQSPQTAALVIERLLAGIASLDRFPRRFKLAPRQARAKHPVH